MFQTDKSLVKAAEDALSYMFHIGYQETNNGWKNASFYFVETVSIEFKWPTVVY